MSTEDDDLLDALGQRNPHVPRTANIAVDIGVLKNEQKRQGESIDKLTSAVQGMATLEPTIRSLAETVRQQVDSSQSLAQTVTQLTVTVAGIQEDMRQIRIEQRDLEKAKVDLTNRQNSLELKQAAMLSRALPVVFGGLGTLAAIGAAVAAWWN